MPYIFNQKDIPEEIERKKSYLFWGVAALNEILILVYVIVVFIDNIRLSKTEEQLTQT